MWHVTTSRKYQQFTDWIQNSHTCETCSLYDECGLGDVRAVPTPALAAEAALDVHRGRHHVQPRDRIQIADIAALERRGVHRDDLLVGRMRRREAIGVRLAGEPIGERGRFGHG